LNRLDVCSALSKTKLVLWWIGVARAPVTGSGTAAACTARVAKPKARSAPLLEWSLSSVLISVFSVCVWREPPCRTSS